MRRPFFLIPRGALENACEEDAASFGKRVFRSTLEMDAGSDGTMACRRDYWTECYSTRTDGRNQEYRCTDRCCSNDQGWIKSERKKWTHAWTCVAIGGVMIDHVETRVDFPEAISLPFRARMFVEEKEIRSTIVMGIL